MEANQQKKPMTFGDLIESGYRACSKRRAKGIIRLAAKARLIVFQGRGRFTTS
jgi:G3E family GTPase